MSNLILSLSHYQTHSDSHSDLRSADNKHDVRRMCLLRDLRITLVYDVVSIST